MSINIRVATKMDVPALLRLENTLFETDQLSKRQFIYHLKSRKNILLVAEFEEKVIGYILAFVSQYKQARIYSLAVAKEAQGKGIAMLLYKELLKYMPEDLERITLEVNINNSAAIALYKKIGFISEKVLKCYYENDDDAYQMYILITN